MKSLILFYAVALTLISFSIWLESRHPCVRNSPIDYVCLERR